MVYRRNKEQKKDKRESERKILLRDMRNLRQRIRRIREYIEPLIDDAFRSQMFDDFISQYKYVIKAHNRMREWKNAIELTFRSIESKVSLEKRKTRKTKASYDYFQERFEYLENKKRFLEKKIKINQHEMLRNIRKEVDQLEAEGNYESAVMKTYQALRNISTNRFSYLIDDQELSLLLDTLPSNLRDMYDKLCLKIDELLLQKRYSEAKKEGMKAKEVAKKITQGHIRTRLIKYFMNFKLMCESLIVEADADEKIKISEIHIKNGNRNKAISILRETRDKLEDIPLEFRNKKKIHELTNKINYIGR